MRVSKDYQERRNEILDAAENLFTVKGYEACTVNDILSSVGIAKGTFYYYFKSKEEVLDAIIDRVTQGMAAKAKEAVSDKELPPMIKILNVFLSMRVQNDVDPGLMDELHKPENALMHQKTLNAAVSCMIPILEDVVVEGNQSGSFHSEYPKQYMEIFMISAVTLLDEGIFQVGPSEQQMMFRALIAILGKMLGIPDEPMWNEVLKYWIGRES